MASQVQDLVLKLRYDGADAVRGLGDVANANQKLNTSAEQAKHSTESLGREMQKTSTVAIALGTATGNLIAGALSKLPGLIGDLVQRGTEITPVAKAFDQLGVSIGPLREATQGLVTDFDLMKSSNQAMLLGLDASKFADLAGAAVTLGRTVGRDAVQSIDSMVGALGRNSFELLDNLGITLRVEEAQKLYAEQLGKTTNELTKQEEAEAFRVIATQKIIEKSKMMAEADQTAGDALTRLTTTLTNMSDAAARGANESGLLAGGLNDVADIVDKLQPKIESMAKSWADNFGRGLSVIRHMSVESAALAEAADKSAIAIANRRKELASELEYIATADERYAKLANELEGLASATDISAKEQKKLSKEYEDGKKKLDEFNKALIDQATFIRAVREAAIGPFLIDREEALEALKDYQKRQEESVENYRRQLEDAYRASTDFWSEIITGVIEGDLESTLTNMLKRSAVQFGAEMLAQMTMGFNPAALLSGGSVFAGGAASSGAAGTGAAGAGGALAGIGIGAGAGMGLAAAGTAYSGFNFYNDIRGGGGASLLDSAVLAPITGGFSLLGPLAGGFGSGKGEDQRYRDQLRESLRERGIIDGNDSFSIFGGGRGSLSPGGEFDGIDAGNEQFAGLGGLLSVASGGDNALKDLFADALGEAENFNAAALTTTSLLEQMGYNAEESQQLLIQAYAQGQISLGEFNEAMDASRQLMVEDLASIDEGVLLIKDSLDGPVTDSVKAMQLTYKEFKDAGVNDTEALLAIIQEKMGSEAAAVYRRLAENGIDQFTDFNNLSAAQLQLLFNEIENLKGPMADLGEAAESAGSRGASGLDKIKKKAEEVEGAAKKAKKAVAEVGA